MRSVYITRIAKFLPNDPVSNEEMESVLGMVDGIPSKARPIILRNNGIKKRYYAFRDGKSTHTSAQLAALAIKNLFANDEELNEVELLAIGTNTPDQLLPSHASMVHGELGMNKRAELASVSGACCNGTQALKYAFMSVGSGLSDHAVACASEKPSTWMHASRFQPEADNLKELEKNPIIAFEKDFLRWMLSDGAGAALLEPAPNAEGISLKIEWIEITSFANELETCMYAGATKNGSAALTGWNDMPVEEWHHKSVFAMKQDTRLLGENIVPKGGEFLSELIKKYNLKVSDVDYYLPHMSSEYFKNQIMEYHKKIGLDIPQEKWFYNLTYVGNVGSASPYLMLEELFHSGRLKKGEKILVMVPESARFSYAYIYLTVV